MISIIVPVYNAEKYLHRCLDSLTEQTNRDYEVVLVDDGSKDGSPAICDEYAERYDFVKVFHQPNGGRGAALNRGLSLATGSHIAFVDSDDWIEPNTVELLNAALDRFGREAESVAYGYVIDFPAEDYHVDKRLERSDAPLPTPDAILAMEAQGMFNSTCNKVYRADLIREQNIQFRLRQEPGEDLLFNSDYFRHVHHCVLLSECLYHYMNQEALTSCNQFDPKLTEKVNTFIQAREDLYAALHMAEGEGRRMLDQTYFEYKLTCVYNAYRGSGIDSRQRKALMKDLLADKVIRRRLADSQGMALDTYQKIFAVLFRVRSVGLAHLAYTLLFCARRRFQTLYQQIRKKTMHT